MYTTEDIAEENLVFTKQFMTLDIREQILRLRTPKAIHII